MKKKKPGKKLTLQRDVCNAIKTVYLSKDLIKLYHLQRVSPKRNITSLLSWLERIIRFLILMRLGNNHTSRNFVHIFN